MLTKEMINEYLFPTEIMDGSERIQPGSPGMTIRQFYAGLAMLGKLINDGVRSYGTDGEIYLAEDSFKQADAMIEYEKNGIPKELINVNINKHI